jgi:hypothetical protein
MLWSALVGVYTRWKFVEDEAPVDERVPSKAVETSQEEIFRLRQTIARERRNLQTFVRFNCAALAAPVESSIRAMESRIHALEMRRAMWFMAFCFGAGILMAPCTRNFSGAIPSSPTEKPWFKKSSA